MKKCISDVPTGHDFQVHVIMLRLFFLYLMYHQVGCFFFEILERIGMSFNFLIYCCPVFMLCSDGALNC